MLPTSWLEGNSGVIPENVETRFLAEEFVCARFDAGEIAKVEMKSLECARSFCMEGFNALDRSSYFEWGTAGNIDCCTFSIEYFN